MSRLRNDHLHPDNPNRIVGTKITNNMIIPSGVRKIIDVILVLSRLKKSNSFRMSF